MRHVDNRDDDCGRTGCNGSLRCAHDGCDALHPNACGADVAVQGWRCPEHEIAQHSAEWEQVRRATAQAITEVAAMRTLTRRRCYYCHHPVPCAEHPEQPR